MLGPGVSTMPTATAMKAIRLVVVGMVRFLVCVRRAISIWRSLHQCVFKRGAVRKLSPLGRGCERSERVRGALSASQGSADTGAAETGPLILPRADARGPLL